MSILINKDTILVVQGITGKEGAFHTKQMVEYGTHVCAGVTPGKVGQKVDNGIPIFNTVSIIPGIETLAPDLTETNNGLFKSPNILPDSFSIFFSSLFIALRIWEFNLFLFW